MVKRAQLILLRDGLQLKYNQIEGQLEMIDAILSGTVGKDVPEGAPPQQ